MVSAVTCRSQLCRTCYLSPLLSRCCYLISRAVPFLGAAMKDGATKGGATRSAFKGKQFTSTVPRMPAAAGEGLFSKKTYEYAAEPFVEAPTASKKEEVKSG